MYKLHDLTHLNWRVTHNGGVSYGCYYKATEVINGKKFYYKCSNFYQNNYSFGDESVYEVICSRLFSKLGFNCVKYSLIFAKVKIQGEVYNTYICKSEDFSVGYEARITLENLHLLYKGVSVDDLITKLGIQSQIREMLLADFLVLQRDRHGGNIELLFKKGKYYLSPLFDNGLGLLAPYPSSFKTDISSFDVLFDYPVYNYIGSRSLFQNLSYINKPIKVNRLLKRDRGALFYNLADVLPKSYLDKIWELITYRYMFLRKRGIIDDTQV